MHCHTLVFLPDAKLGKRLLINGKFAAEAGSQLHCTRDVSMSDNGSQFWVHPLFCRPF